MCYLKQVQSECDIDKLAMMLIIPRLGAHLLGVLIINCSGGV